MVRRSSRVSRKSRSKVNRKINRSRKVSRRVNRKINRSRKVSRRVNKSRRVSRRVNKSRRVNRRRTKRVNKSRRVSRKKTRRIKGGSDPFKKNPSTSSSSSSTTLTPEKILSMALKEEITIQEAEKMFNSLNKRESGVIKYFESQINIIKSTFEKKKKAKEKK